MGERGLCVFVTTVAELSDVICPAIEKEEKGGEEGEGMT